MRSENQIGIAIEELYNIFDVLNAEYYNKELSYPIITIQANKGRILSNGWFTLNKVWKNKQADEKYEINICAERLRDSYIDIAETLNHEMVHYYNKLNDIEDVKNKRHNKKFKARAEMSGLICELDRRFGWCTTYSPEFALMFQNKKDDAFSYFRDIVLKDKPAVERKKKIFKYKCPLCEEEIKAKLDVKVICGNCNEVFEFNDKEK